MIKFIATLACVAVLAACAETKRYDEMTYTERQQFIEKLVQLCRDQGVKDRTSEMEACFRAEAEREINKRDRARENAEVFGAALSEGMTTYGNSMSQSASTYRGPVNCSSYRLGSTVQTNCY